MGWGIRAGPGPPLQTTFGLDNPLGDSAGDMEHTNVGQEKKNETGGGNCFQRSFKKEEKLMYDESSEKKSLENYSVGIRGGYS